MPLEPLKKLGPRHHKLLALKASGQSTAEAARAVGVTEDYARHLMQQPLVQSALQQKMDEVGITDQKIAEKINEGLDALTPPKKEGGRRYEDFFTRRLYLDMVLKLKGEYAPEKKEETKKIIHLTITPEAVKGFMDAGVIDAEIVDEAEQPVESQDPAPRMIEEPEDKGCVVRGLSSQEYREDPDEENTHV